MSKIRYASENFYLTYLSVCSVNISSNVTKRKGRKKQRQKVALRRCKKETRVRS